MVIKHLAQCLAYSKCEISVSGYHGCYYLRVVRGGSELTRSSQVLLLSPSPFFSGILSSVPVGSHRTFVPKSWHIPFLALHFRNLACVPPKDRTCAYGGHRLLKGKFFRIGGKMG